MRLPRLPALPALAAALAALLAVPALASAQTMQVSRPEEIPGLEVTVEPAGLQLAPGEHGNMTATLRYDGNETLDLRLGVFIHNPGQRGGMVVVGGPGSAGGPQGPPPDDAFAVEVGNATLRLEPGTVTAVPLRFTALARNQTSRMGVLHVDEASAEPPGPDDPPPRAELVEFPLRIRREAAAGDGSPAPPQPAPVSSEPRSETPAEDPAAVPAFDVVGLALAALGSAVLCARVRRARR